MKRKKEILKEIQKLLSQLPLRDKLEVLANYFIILGVSRIDGEDSNVAVPLKHSELVSIIMDEREKRGETLGAALAGQGLYIMMWLDSLKEE